MLAAGAVVGALMASAYDQGLADPRVFPGVRVEGRDLGGKNVTELESLSGSLGQSSLARTLTLRAGEVAVETSPGALGASAVPGEALEAALEVGRGDDDLLHNLRARALARRGDVDLRVALALDDRGSIDELSAIAPEVEQPSLPTRFDLEERRVLAAERGTALLVHDSLSRVAVGLASGADTIDLVVQRKPGVDDDPLGPYAELDLSVALGKFSTSFQQDAAHADRSYNLKLGASAVDGVVLEPGQVFSFNEVVGPRSAEAGYRYAPGITAGELVDVLGGGICQVASSLFGAAYFGGLEVVSARPHSRPSSYIDMGLDATVVYPTIDLKLRNPYDFPVVLHMSANHGQVEAEVLGPRRPYQVVFERELKEVKPYSTVVRDDDRLLAGASKVAQRGRRGFVVKRRRTLLQGDEEVANEEWRLEYPATTEIVRRGTNPAGERPEAKKLPPLRDPEAHLVKRQ